MQPSSSVNSLPSAAAIPPLSPPRGALLAIFLVVLVDMLGFGLVVPLLPIYARQFHASAFEVTLLFSLFSIFQFIGSPLLGMASDRIGRRPVLFASQMVTCVAYALLAWTTGRSWAVPALGLGMIYLSRIVAGLGGGNIATASAYISDVTTTENRARGMGMLGAAFGIGFSIGPAVGGMLAHYVSPSAPAWLAMGMAGISAILAGLLIPNSPRRATGDTALWLHPARFKPLFANRPLMRINLAWFIAMGAFVAMDSAVVMFLLDVFGYKERQVAYYFLLVGMVIIITQGGLVGRLNDWLGEWTMCIAGLILVAVGASVVGCTSWRAATAVLVIGAIIHAFGRSLFQPTIAALVSQHSDPAEQGLSYGFFQGVGALARAAGPLGAGVLYSLHHSLPWFVGALFLTLTGIWLGSVRRGERKLSAECVQ